MKENAHMVRTVCAVIAATCIAGSTWCFAEGADAPKDLQKARDFYRAGQQSMLNGDYASANEAFMKAEIILRTGQEMPAVAEPLEIPARPAPQREQPRQPARALDPDIYYNLGVGALHKGDFIQAEAAFLRVLELTPLDKEACYNLGVLYEKYLDKPQDAIRYYTRYVNLADDSDGDVEQVKAWIKDIKERARN